jgi:hypothetical protein
MTCATKWTTLILYWQNLVADESKQLEKTIIPHVIKLVIQFINGTLEYTSYKNLE